MPMVGPIVSHTEMRQVGRSDWPGRVENGAGTEIGGAESFNSYLKGAIDEINTLQRDADAATRAMATGDVSDIHRAVIAGEKATLAMQLVIEVRNKVIEAYQEIMRMQI